MTLVEVMFAMGILALLLGGILATMMQSRRLTEGSITRMFADTIAESYIEQIRGMSISTVANQGTGSSANLSVSFSIPTMSSLSGTGGLNTTAWTSSTTIPSVLTLTAGTTPSGVVDNLQDFAAGASGNLSSSGAALTSGTAQSWSAIWPGARTVPSTTPYSNDLHMNFWIWVSDLSVGAASSNVAQVYGVTLIYTWQVNDGARTRYYMDQLRTICSSVPSYSGI